MVKRITCHELLCKLQDFNSTNTVEPYTYCHIGPMYQVSSQYSFKYLNNQVLHIVLLGATPVFPNPLLRVTESILSKNPGNQEPTGCS